MDLKTHTENTNNQPIKNMGLLDFVAEDQPAIYQFKQVLFCAKHANIDKVYQCVSDNNSPTMFKEEQPNLTQSGTLNGTPV